MGLADLEARLEREAERRVAELRARTQAEADAVLAEAGRAREAERDRALAVRGATRRAQLERELGAARQRARSDRLRAQHALLARVFSRAAALIEEVGTSDGYAAGLGAHLALALRYFEGAPAVVRCRPDLAGALRGALAAHPAVELAPDPALPPGFKVCAGDDRVVVDETLPARLVRLAPWLSVRLLAEVSP
ncbi:MAG: V-type ATP synthase subunit E [Myxococcaceae bacterium]